MQIAMCEPGHSVEPARGVGAGHLLGAVLPLDESLGLDAQVVKVLLRPGVVRRVRQREQGQGQGDLELGGSGCSLSQQTPRCTRQLACGAVEGSPFGIGYDVSVSRSA